MTRNEKTLQYQQFMKLVIIIICSGLYAWGGMEHKWLRRYLAPSIAGLGIFTLYRDWKYLIKMPLLMLSSTIGYGADEFVLKVFKRFYVGLAFGISCSVTEIIKKSWPYVIASVIILPTLYISLGVFNPFPARVEETFLGLIVYGFAIMPYKGEKNE